MSKAEELIRAILEGHHPEGMTAAAILTAALIAEIDPIAYCVLAGWSSEAEALKRAARWAGLAFFETVPRGLTGSAQPERLEALAEVRTFRLRLLDRDVLFCAPTFFNLLQLRQRVQAVPVLMKQLCLVPESALRAYLVDASSEALVAASRQRLARRWPFATAHLASTLPARIAFVVGLVVIVALVLLSPFLPHPVLLPLALLLIALPAMLSLAALMEPHRVPEPIEHWDVEAAELPVYSVLIPLCDEAHMVPQLARAMLALDYPPSRLDVKFVVEARSAPTVAAVRAQLHHAQFSLVCVPDALPRTKPKALDYALPLCRGEHVVVFDAEDRPDPAQLRQAARQFRDRPAVQCIQAELVIDNAAQSPLAALFAGEYAGLFGVKLPALARWGLPVPLGGTSNHFRTETLREVGGWDAYNVTEDADLGVRLARLRLTVATIPVPTFEEAPTQLRSWLSQRTRWMKGWMQTFIVHNRYPFRALAEMGWWPFLAFEVMALGQILAPLLHSGYLLLNLTRLALQLPLLGSFEADWHLVYPAMFIFGYAAAVLQTLAGLFRLGGQRPTLVQLLLPLYWLLISVATIRALIELVNRPFYWAKTAHVVAHTAENRPARPVVQRLEPAD